VKSNRTIGSIDSLFRRMSLPPSSWSCVMNDPLTHTSMIAPEVLIFTSRFLSRTLSVTLFVLFMWKFESKWPKEKHGNQCTEMWNCEVPGCGTEGRREERWGDWFAPAPGHSLRHFGRNTEHCLFFFPYWMDLYFFFFYVTSHSARFNLPHGLEAMYEYTVRPIMSGNI
jgi:hypothetical protein